ncbi:hypothetical protein GALMADRAFT_240601 [Galerina marginata CBS 339.88]|uniref:AIG1-type G domain-containing protein n=1 Tax=Galerina marginata (strain CBS 339.88) TaxID=685588 RepID=A0A067TIC7_GALM3|nr:hypothetical protein GALMADRAFT_240601 [Galerina marginata CBS 339.88]
MPSRNSARVQPENLNLKEDDLLILFMGPTGSGKSHIIDILSERDEDEKRASSRLKSSTSAVSVTRLKQGDGRLVLIDTPGFDDTDKSDMQILEIISQSLVQAYKTKCQIVGIIYLHRITDNRIAETVHRSFHVFSELCGYDAAQNVVLVTTMWDEIEGEGVVGEEREKEFKEKLWAGMLSHGASTTRFDNTPDSARKIISRVVGQTVCNDAQSAEEVIPTGVDAANGGSEGGKNPDHPVDNCGDVAKPVENGKGVILRLQQEMVKEKKRIKQTQAGHALYAPLSIILAEQAGTNKARNGPANLSDLQQLQDQIDDILKQLRPKAVQRVLNWGRGFVQAIRLHPKRQSDDESSQDSQPLAISTLRAT